MTMDPISFTALGLVISLVVLLAFQIMTDVRYGVISIGRTRRARASLRSVALLNTAFLALIVASAGFFATSIILFTLA
jgi:hypothetical protein